MKKILELLGIFALLLCQTMQAQELNGTILKDGKPQKNIRVWLKHNKGVAKTDKQGQFTLFNVLPTDTLVMGVSNKYDAQLAIGSQSNITIHLEDDGFTVEAGLDEVTVTAPTKLRTEYTSAITLKKMRIINHNTIMRESIRSVSVGSTLNKMNCPCLSVLALPRLCFSHTLIFFCGFPSFRMVPVSS